MRAAAISLLALVLILLVNVVGIFVSPAYKSALQNTFGVTGHSVSKNPAIAEEGNDMEKLSDTLDRLAVGLDALSSTGSTTGSGMSESGSTNEVPVPAKPEPKVYPLSVPLQAKLMPDIFIKQAENRGIFDIRIFTNLDYTTYRDDKNKLNIYAFAESYPIMLTNLKLVSNVYTLKETNSFFDASFFLNATNKRDTTVRFVTSLGGKAYGFEVPKTFYPKIKKLLTSK